MKKILFLLSLSLLITGCTSTETVSDNNKINELEQKIIDLQSQQASTTATTLPTTTSVTTIEASISKTTEIVSKSTSAPKPQEKIPVSQIVKEITCPQNAYKSGNICYCNAGYFFNSDNTYCATAVNLSTPIPITTTPTQQSININNSICQNKYGLNANWNGTTDSTGNIICGCNSGYLWNEQETSCITTPVKIESPEIKIAKCEAEKTQQAQTYQQLENAMKQMTYQNTLKQLEEISPCGEAFYPDAISACREGQYKVAKNAATDLYNQEHSKNLIKIQNNYINCLNQ